MRCFLALALLLSVAGLARAGATIGVVAVGGDSVQPVVQAQIESWLRAHGHAVRSTPLQPDALTTFLDCDVIEDDNCMRDTVQKRADSEAVLFARVGTSTDAKTGRAILLEFRWFVKGRAGAATDPIMCNDCSDARLVETIAVALAKLVGDSKIAMGSLRITSKPSGLGVLIDERPAGSTPLGKDLPEGMHTITVTRNGVKVGERLLRVDAGEEYEIDIPVRASSRPRSRLVPGILIGVGALAIAAGATLYVTSETDDGTRLYYTDTRPAGIATAGGGTALLLGGALVMLLRGSGEESGPVVTATTRDGMVGWCGRF